MNSHPPGHNIDDKIFHIRDTLLKLGNSLDQDNDDRPLRPRLMRTVGSVSSNEKGTLENFLTMKQDEDQRRFEAVFSRNSILRTGNSPGEK